MKEKIRILILEDSASDAELMQRVLKQGRIKFIASIADNKTSFLSELEKFIPDVIISDHSLPQFDALEALSIVKQRNLKIPFILVTGAISEERAAQCIESGVDDYILKDRLARLPAAVKSALSKYNTEKELIAVKKTAKEAIQSIQSIIGNNISAIMFVKDLDSKYVLVNRQFEKLFKMSNKEIQGKTAHHYLPKETADGFRENELYVIDSGKPLETEDKVAIEENDIHYFHTTLSPLYDDEEKAYGVFGISTDITEKKRMQENLVESENKYRKIIEESGDVLYITGVEGNFAYINPRVKVLTGYSSEELIGKHFTGLIAPDWEEKVRLLYLEQFQNKVAETMMEFPIITKSGEKKWVEQIVVMLKKGDWIEGFQCVVRDITERKKANLLLAEQNAIIERKNKDILDSINYAKRIQDVIFPPDELVKELFPDSFILFKPKDIVSGDFYWVEKHSGKVFIAAVDCTGHGVPGALMSVIGYNLLGKSIKEYGYSRPDMILNELSNGMYNTLRQTIENPTVRDSMDIALCAIDTEKKVLKFAGAYNPLYLIRKKKLIEVPADRVSIGVFAGNRLQRFTNHEVKLKKGDTIYLFSDGYADQFGGPQGKKFKYKPLQELLISIQSKTMNEQKEILAETIEEWRKMSNEEQLDDILIIGLKIS